MKLRVFQKKPARAGGGDTRQAALKQPRPFQTPAPPATQPAAPQPGARQQPAAPPRGHDFGGIAARGRKGTEGAGGARALPDDLRAGVERLSGVRLDDVRVHYDSPAPARFDASAHTQGTEIHLAPGGELHLAHEAWHVVQQKRGRVRATARLSGHGVNDDSALEREADVMGARAVNARDANPRTTKDAGARAPSRGSRSARPTAAANASPVVQCAKEDEAATKIQRAWRAYAAKMKGRAPNVSNETRRHVHVGDNRTDAPTEAGKKLWSGGGLHHIGGLQRRRASEGVTINELTNDPSGTLLAKVTKTPVPSAKPGKTFPGGTKGTKKSEPYTLYPPNVSPLQSDVLAQQAFEKAQALHKRTGVDAVGRAGIGLLPPGHQPEGRFTSYMPNPGGTKKLLKIQGHYRDPDAPQITSHYPLPSEPSDLVHQRRYEKWKRKGNWQKLQQLGYTATEEVERMKAENKGRRARKYADYLRGKKKERADRVG